MALNRVPSFQEVKDWANGKFNYFDGGDARNAVDNSNVSVGYADDAGTLGGQSPSNYETPNSTQTGYRAGGSTLINTGTGSQNLSPNVVGDQVVLEFSDSGNMDYDLFVNGTQKADNRNINSGSHSYNVTLENISSIEIIDRNNGNQTLSVYVNRPAVGPHSLPI